MEALVQQVNNYKLYGRSTKIPNIGGKYMVDKVLGWIRSLTEIGLALIALGVVLQIIFGAAVPFLGIDVVGSVVTLVKQLGAEGLVGLVAIWMLWGIYSKK